MMKWFRDARSLTHDAVRVCTRALAYPLGELCVVALEPTHSTSHTLVPYQQSKKWDLFIERGALRGPLNRESQRMLALKKYKEL